MAVKPAQRTAIALGKGALWLVVQIRRVQYQDLVRRKSFPEYAKDARRVSMLISGLRLGGLERSGTPEVQSG